MSDSTKLALIGLGLAPIEMALIYGITRLFIRLQRRWTR